jgi:hypothetical protein
MSYAGPRQVSPNTGFYITVGDCRNKIFSYNPTAGAVTFSAATWTSTGATSSLVQAAGAGVLRDMGKTIVSATRTFRKVQLVVSSPTTFGVGGPAVGGTVTFSATGEDYLSGYIELGFPSASSVVAPVAAYGR